MTALAVVIGAFMELPKKMQYHALTSNGVSSAVLEEIQFGFMFAMKTFDLDAAVEGPKH